MTRPAERIPDTNVILRYLLEDHPTLSPRAAEFFSAVRTGERKALITEGVIAESVHVLTRIYRVPRERAATSLMGLLNYRGITSPDRLELFEGLSLYGRSGLDIVDALLVARARRRHLEPFSFDRELMHAFNSGQEDAE